MNLGKLPTAMITPFTRELTIDYTELPRLIDHLLSTGTTAIVVNGTTAESPTLSGEEKIELIGATVQHVAGRVPVIAGTGSNNTQQSIDFTRAVEQVGVDGSMLVAPYYNKPNQRSMVAHFTAIADVATKPIMLYNIPGRSVVNMDTETTVTLSQHPHILWMKEASGNLNQISEVMRKSASSLQVYSGDDGLTLPLLSIGSSGTVSVAAHVVGPEMTLMIEKFEQGNVQEAAHMHQLLLPVFEALFTSPNPTVVKYALSKVASFHDAVRLPLLSLSEDEKKQFDSIWDDFKDQWNNLVENAKG
ncbi:4-hydroxy-tetrahydrodipicolinate synthase [Chryseomicrobium palamuruense]|uniref:4-hydroxy-tetrahydrodipicolinate synthase n=1 Tax=Chryseomicrobium palamuruense TaxID=682973 RepID=A0ABV8UT54_9BACL